MSQPKRTEMCAQCKVNPLDRKGEPKWCKECWARYQREYRVLHPEMARAKGFALGADAMRREISAHFQQFPFAHFAGREISQIISTIPAPRFQESEALKETRPASNGA